MLSPFGVVILFWIVILVTWLFFGRKNPSPNQLPGPISFPFIGSAIQLGFQARNLKHFELFEKLCKKYGPIVKVKAGALDIVIVEDYEIARKVLCSDDFSGRFPATSLFYGPTLNQNCGIFFGHGDSWREIRRFTLRSFHDLGFVHPETLENAIGEELEEFLTNFDALLSEGHGRVSFRHSFNLPALNLVWRIMAGSRLSVSNQTTKKLILSAAKLSSLPSIGTQPLYVFPFLQYIPGASNYKVILREFRKMQQVFQDILDQRRRLGSYKIVQNDYIDFFLKEIDEQKGRAGSQYTDAQLVQACVDLVLAGSDTTSNTLEFMMLYLTKFPEVQDKLRQEIESVVGNRSPTLQDRINMPYTEAVIMESLRFANTAPVMYRTAVRQTSIAGCVVEMNTIVNINLTRIHMNDQLWDNPEEFRPRRFLDSNNKIIKDHKLLAFGGGKRVCLGKQLAKATLFAFLTTIVQKYTLEALETDAELSLVPAHSAITNVPTLYHSLVKLRKRSG